MTLYEFNVLSLENQQKSVWELGTYLDNFITKDFTINCYAIDRFFVEVYYNSDHNKIVKVTAFKNGKNLDKYSNLNFEHE